MAYLPNIPAAADQISTSQGQIQGNFTSIGTVFDQNHVDFNSGAGIAGQHSFIQLAAQAPTPAFNGIPGFWVTNATNDIMVHNSAGNDANITAYTCNTTGLGTGYFYLPCGILVQFGRQHVVAGAGVINFPIAYPAGHIPYVLLTGMQSTAGGFSTYASVNNTAGLTNALCNVNLRQQNAATYQMVAATGDVEWIAIGI